jgi:hypothetical protein
MSQPGDTSEQGYDTEETAAALDEGPPQLLVLLVRNVRSRP